MKRAHRLLALLLIGLLGWSCESKHPWEGLYTEQPGQGAAATVTLVLQSGGKGQWTAEQESTPLRWEERSDALWLHLKTGAVLVAQLNPADKSIILDLPGIGTLLLRKVT
jgi:hypothetical protein